MLLEIPSVVVLLITIVGSLVLILSLVVVSIAVLTSWSLIRVVVVSHLARWSVAIVWLILLLLLAILLTEWLLVWCEWSILLLLDRSNMLLLSEWSVRALLLTILIRRVGPELLLSVRCCRTGLLLVLVSIVLLDCFDLRSWCSGSVLGFAFAFVGSSTMFAK